MIPFDTTPCKGCGRPIVFAITPDGAKMPLDPKALTYFVYADPAGTIRCQRIPKTGLGDMDGGIPDGYPMVSHFATCKAAKQFSSSSHQEVSHERAQEKRTD